MVLARLSAISCPFKTQGKLNNMTCWEGGQLLVRHLYFCCLSCCYKFLTLAFHFWYFSLGQIKDGFVTSGSLQMRQLQAMKYAPAFKGRTGNLLLGIWDGEGFREHEWGFCLRSALAASMCKTNKPASCVPGGWIEVLWSAGGFTVGIEKHTAACVGGTETWLPLLATPQLGKQGQHDS